MFRSVACTTVVLVSLLFTMAATAADIREGLWTVTASIEMPGMSQGFPVQTQTICLKNSDLRNPNKIIPSDPSCRMKNSQIDGNKMLWQLQCGGITGTGEVTFQSESFAGIFKTNVAGTADTMQMTMQYSGRRVGDCK